MEKVAYHGFEKTIILAWPLTGKRGEGELNYEGLEMGLGIKEIVVEIHSEKW